MSLPSNRFLGGGSKKDIQTAIIKTKNVGENRKKKKTMVPRSFFFSFSFSSVESFLAYWAPFSLKWLKILLGSFSNRRLDIF